MKSRENIMIDFYCFIPVPEPGILVSLKINGKNNLHMLEEQIYYYYHKMYKIIAFKFI